MAKAASSTRKTSTKSSKGGTTTGATTSASSITKTRQAPVTLTEEQIRARAYEIFQRRNGAPGDAQGDWLQAVQELTTELSK
ncbi:MAG: DUF2934 domain-containing protein [Phycisphaerales bacterium]|nr:DUF2934 domain-containing protein [Phycisphaerales bacterium]